MCNNSSFPAGRAQSSSAYGIQFILNESAGHSSCRMLIQCQRRKQRDVNAAWRKVMIIRTTLTHQLGCHFVFASFFFFLSHNNTFHTTSTHCCSCCLIVAARIFNFKVKKWQDCLMHRVRFGVMSLKCEKYQKWPHPTCIWLAPVCCLVWIRVRWLVGWLRLEKMSGLEPIRGRAGVSS